jgi:hypothetical protein
MRPMERCHSPKGEPPSDEKSEPVRSPKPQAIVARNVLREKNRPEPPERSAIRLRAHIFDTLQKQTPPSAQVFIRMFGDATSSEKTVLE